MMLTSCYTTGGHIAPPARGGHPLRQSCRCRPLCVYLMSSGLHRNPADRPLPCLRWWWVVLIVRATCPPAPAWGKLIRFTMKRNHVLQCYKTMCPTYHKFLRADPVVLRELDIELDVKISLVEGVSVLWHPLSSHHPDWAWGQEKHSQWTQTFPSLGFIHGAEFNHISGPLGSKD